MQASGPYLRPMTPCYIGDACYLAILAALRVFLRSRNDTALEVLARKDGVQPKLALRQQAAILKRQPTAAPLLENRASPLVPLAPRAYCLPVDGEPRQLGSSSGAAGGNAPADRSRISGRFTAALYRPWWR